MSSGDQPLAQAIAAQLGGGNVQHTSAQQYQWRGVLYDLKTQIELQPGFAIVKVEVQNPLGEFTLTGGPKMIPDPTAVDNDAFDGTEEVRVWVGRCVVIECYGIELEQQLAGFRSFPPQATGYLIEGMQRDNVSVLGVEKSELVGYVVRDQPDVASATVRFAQLLAWSGAQLKGLAPTAQQAVAAATAEVASPSTRVRCRYCRALFLISQLGRCPNCGAPTG